MQLINRKHPSWRYYHVRQRQTNWRQQHSTLLCLNFFDFFFFLFFTLTYLYCLVRVKHWCRLGLRIENRFVDFVFLFFYFLREGTFFLSLYGQFLIEFECVHPQCFVYVCVLISIREIGSIQMYFTNELAIQITHKCPRYSNTLEEDSFVSLDTKHLYIHQKNKFTQKKN